MIILALDGPGPWPFSFFVSPFSIQFFRHSTSKLSWPLLKLPFSKTFDWVMDEQPAIGKNKTKTKNRALIKLHLPNTNDTSSASLSVGSISTLAPKVSNNSRRSSAQEANYKLGWVF